MRNRRLAVLAAALLGLVLGACQPGIIGPELSPEEARLLGQSTSGTALVMTRNLYFGGDVSRVLTAPTPQEVPFFILAPAFLTSELKTAFQIGFVLFIPFLIIDLVVASVLMAMGMMMLSPVIISLPFKIMLFVLVDGWALVIGSLTTSFG